MNPLPIPRSIVLGAVEAADWLGPSVIAALVALALILMALRNLRTYAFTVWVFVFVAASMFYPAAFGTWFGADDPAQLAGGNRDCGHGL